MNAISVLNEMAQRSRVSVLYEEKQGRIGRGPTGEVTHDRTAHGWTVVVSWGSKQVAYGWGKTKKDAKRVAANNAMRVLGLAPDSLESGEVLLPNVDVEPPAALKEATAMGILQPAPPVPPDSVQGITPLSRLQHIFPNRIEPRDLGEAWMNRER